MKDPANQETTPKIPDEHEVCASCGCFEHCCVLRGPTLDGQGEGKIVVCEHCDDDPPHRPRCQWSEANLAEQVGRECRDALTFYPMLPSSRELREEMEDHGFLNDDHEWTTLGERVALAIRGRRTS